MFNKISCIITFHREGLLAHTTLLSIESARQFAESQGYIVEFVITIDFGDSLTEWLVKNHPAIRSTDIIEHVNYGDLGSSRNHAIAISSGEIVICMDGDDYFSTNYIASYASTINENNRYIAYPEYIFSFDKIYAIQNNSGKLPASPYTLFLTHPYCSSVGAMRYVFESYPYQKMSAGFGFEDWHWNCEVTAGGFLHKAAHESVLFYRRKNISMVNDYMRQAAIIPPSKLFKMVPLPDDELGRQEVPLAVSPEFAQPVPHLVQQSCIPYTSIVWKDVVKFIVFSILRKLPVSIGNRIYNKLHRIHTAKHPVSFPSNSIEKKFDSAVFTALRDLAKIDGLLHPDYLPHVTIYVPPNNETPGKIYARAWHMLRRHDYDIVYTVPCIGVGGADLMVRNYIHCACSAGKHVLCITTLPRPSEVSALPEQVDFLPIGELIASLPAEHQQLIITRLLLELAPKTLHIVNDGWTFPCIIKHGNALAHASRIVASFYTDVHEDDYGLCLGPATINLRAIYPYVAKVVTDNAINQKEWMKRFGLPEEIFIPVYGLIDSVKEECVNPQKRDRILWVGRFDQQKRIDIVLSIAEAMPDIHFDIYGVFVLENSHPAVEKLQQLSNVSLYYKIINSCFSSLPIEQYFAYLYTTQYDGLPIVLLEATAVGLPVVAPDRGGVRDFITSETGILIADYTDISAYVKALREIQEHPEEAAGRWRNAREIVVSRHNAQAFRQSLFTAYGW